LGVLNLEVMNDSLLSKWLWYIENSNGLWQKIIASKYLKGKPLILVKQKQNDSHFWKKLLSLRDIFYKYCKTDVGNGLKTSFWKSTWLGNQPLSSQFHVLFDLAYDKDVSVNEVFTSNFESLTFRRKIVGNLKLLYDELINYCNQVCLSDQEDKIVWTLGNKGFSVNSLYRKKMENQSLIPYKFLWKSKLPHKIKVFFWLVVRNKILTKDNLRKRCWIGSLNCCFCGVDETIDHLFFKCPIAQYMWRVIQVALNLRSIPKNIKDLYDNWFCKPKDKMAHLVLFGCGALFWAIWRTRNDWCFGKNHLLDPSNIIFLCCFWLDSWAIRQKKKEQRMVVLGSKLIRKTASEAFGRALGWCPLGHLTGVFLDDKKVELGSRVWIVVCLLLAKLFRSFVALCLSCWM
jgi:hypothetical protein